MRILHVISSMEVGGAQRLLSDLLPILKQQGFDVSLLVLKSTDSVFSKKIADAGVKIISLDVRSFRNPFLAIKLRHIINQYDIVHAHLVHSLYLCSIAARGLETKLIYTEHSTLNNRRGKSYLRGIEKLIYNRYDKLISISQKVQDALQDWLQSNDKRFDVINNGVDINTFAALHKEKIPKSLIMVSRFASSKDQKTVIRALTYLKENIILRFVGDGENLEQCRHFANVCGLNSKVQFLGTRTDVAELIAESCIGIQSSKWEGFGLTAVEMMAAGLPVIATDVDGLKQVVEGAGVLFPVGDAFALSDHIRHILNDKVFYEELSIASKRRASLYDISIMSRKYTELYQSVCNE